MIGLPLLVVLLVLSCYKRAQMKETRSSWTVPRNRSGLSSCTPQKGPVFCIHLSCRRSLWGGEVLTLYYWIYRTIGL